jgi:hypothetical protein
LSPLPRILTIMGSGETAPTMVKVHRAVLERLGPPPVPAVLLDTPFGFQENATELAQKVVAYFAESLRTKIEVAGISHEALEGDGRPIGLEEDRFADERLFAKVRDAQYLFAGPGSPSYALRKWKGTVVPSLLTETLEHGGAVTFSSAAALTLGFRTVPVYEIYKVGEEPFWLEGLDVLAVTGLKAAVIPHYNNAEGGTHDTRFCYLGERRLSLLEAELPEDAFVLGIDEHTAVVMDLDSRQCSVEGIGTLTVRAKGVSRSWASGETLTIEEIEETARQLATRGAEPVLAPTAGSGPAEPESMDEEPDAAMSGARYEGSPLLAVVREKESAFAAAIARRDASEAVKAVLELDASITEWSHDIPAGDALDRAQAALRSLIVELGRTGEQGLRDPREMVAPLVEAMLELRRQARAAKRFEEADAIRDDLLAAGVEVRDATDGSEWLLTEDFGAGSTG